MEIQWPLLIFSLLAGCGGGLLAFAGISEVLGIAKKTRFPVAIAVLVLLFLGGCASVLHLGHPSNIMAAATNIFSFSGISVELILLGINFVVAIVYLVLLKRENSEAPAKIVGIIGIITGVLMAFVVGNGYVIVGQPLWNTPMLPLAYLGSGLAMGGTFFASLMIAFKEDTAELKRVTPFVLGAVVIQLAAFLAYGAVIGFAGDIMLYWVGSIVLGSVAALICVALQSKNTGLVYGALVCTLIGGICFRALMWTLGSGFVDLFGVPATRGIFGM